MSYARKLLARNEEIVFESGQHWFVVVGRSWWAIILAILALAVVIWVAGPPEEGLDPAAEIVTLGLLLLALARIGWVIWDWRNTEFLVTTRRIIRAEGILNKRMSDSSLEKVNDAHLTQSIFGRIFGFGDLDILTAADEMGGIEDFPLLADPVDFKVAMMNQKEILEHPELAPPPYQRTEPHELRPAEPMPPRAGSDRVTVMPEPDDEPEVAPPATESRSAPAAAPATSAASTSADDAAATLERLADLRDRGLITVEEYDAKKRELLERI
jgi:hypothetical protein